MDLIVTQTRKIAVVILAIGVLALLFAVALNHDAVGTAKMIPLLSNEDTARQVELDVERQSDEARAAFWLGVVLIFGGVVMLVIGGKTKR